MRRVTKKKAAVGKRAVAGGIRERILDAAIGILRKSGVQRLTQVHIAEAAGVRQSHLTYYFPTRDDLLEAVTAKAVDGIACGVRRAVEDQESAGDAAVLERLAAAVVEPEHMRMFLGLIVEADGDPSVRKLLTAGTCQLESALTDALGGEDSEQRARLLLAAVWGLGLYEYVMRPATSADPTIAYLSWLSRQSAAPQGRAKPERRRQTGA